MLNQTNINIVESIIMDAPETKFITNSDNKCPSISYRYYPDARFIYNEIKTAPINSYELFASNGMGYQSYGFYKASNEKMYIIEASMESVSYIYEIGDKFKDMIEL
jgi:hypothetical protein